MVRLMFTVTVLVLLAGCSAEVGSDSWCADLKEKSKADWSATELKDFAKHCVFK